MSKSRVALILAFVFLFLCPIPVSAEPVQQELSLTAIVYTRRSRLVYTTHDRLVYTRHDRPMYTTRDRLMYTTWARVATLLRESYPGGVTDGAATHEPFA